MNVMRRKTRRCTLKEARDFAVSLDLQKSYQLKNIEKFLYVNIKFRFPALFKADKITTYIRYEK